VPRPLLYFDPPLGHAPTGKKKLWNGRLRRSIQSLLRKQVKSFTLYRKQLDNLPRRRNDSRLVTLYLRAHQALKVLLARQHRLAYLYYRARSTGEEIAQAAMIEFLEERLHGLTQQLDCLEERLGFVEPQPDLARALENLYNLFYQSTSSTETSEHATVELPPRRHEAGARAKPDRSAQARRIQEKHQENAERKKKESEGYNTVRKRKNLGLKSSEVHTLKNPPDEYTPAKQAAKLWKAYDEAASEYRVRKEAYIAKPEKASPKPSEPKESSAKKTPKPPKEKPPSPGRPTPEGKPRELPMPPEASEPATPPPCRLIGNRRGYAWITHGDGLCILYSLLSNDAFFRFYEASLKNFPELRAKFVVPLVESFLKLFPKPENPHSRVEPLESARPLFAPDIPRIDAVDLARLQDWLRTGHTDMLFETTAIAIYRFAGHQNPIV